jgi:hypothetical protein
VHENNNEDGCTFATAYGVEVIRRKHSNFVVNGDYCQEQLEGDIRNQILMDQGLRID